MPQTPSPESSTTAGRPLVGVTCDLVEDQARIRRPYFRAIEAAGGIGIALPPVPGTARSILPRLDALVMSGGDDPDTTPFGEPVHPKATLVAADRQQCELEWIEAIERDRPDLPVLGVCLGMQFMGLRAGGRLDQHLPDHLPTADEHWDGRCHEVRGEITGPVHSHHRQALVEAGDFEVVATAADGVIEAIARPDRPFHLGVQWHPERTTHETTGPDLFRRLIEAAGGGG